MRNVTSWKCNGWVVGCGIGCGYVFELFLALYVVGNNGFRFVSFCQRVLAFCHLHFFSEKITPFSHKVQLSWNHPAELE